MREKSSYPISSIVLELRGSGVGQRRDSTARLPPVRQARSSVRGDHLTPDFSSRVRSGVDIRIGKTGQEASHLI